MGKIDKKRLTWDELAAIYDKQTGGRARTMDMNTIFKWAEKQINKFYVDDDGYLYQIKKTRN